MGSKTVQQFSRLGCKDRPIQVLLEYSGVIKTVYFLLFIILLCYLFNLSVYVSVVFCFLTMWRVDILLYVEK